MVGPGVHHRVRMTGRDPGESHRAATPLELLFDLTFVIAFGAAADGLAHSLAEGHAATGVTGFVYAAFSVAWAWINFSWFASAYDTDDWVFRLVTMVQMVGVLVLALGLPVLFDSIDRGATVDNSVMVAGYVLMRVAMVFQWLRAARQDPARRSACRTYAVAILVAQCGWIGLLVAKTGLVLTLVCSALLMLVEAAGPVIAETREGGTPWHVRHIVERYGLLVIIALGEGLFGTVAAIGAAVESGGWTGAVVALGLVGTATTFGMWWAYFILPSAQVLAVHRERSFGWGYWHVVLFGATVAVGAGVHVAAYYIEHQSALGTTATVLAVAVPLVLFIVALLGIYSQLTRSLDPFHLLLLAGSAALAATSVVMTAAGAALEWSLAVLALSPWVVVVGYETIGHRRGRQVVARITAPPPVTP
jgi:low temperature requirement protein LtrA